MKLLKLPPPTPELVNWVKEALEEVPSHLRRQFEEAVASLVQLERERFVKLLERLHDRPKEYTGSWWRGECPPHCKACEIAYLVKSGEEAK